VKRFAQSRNIRVFDRPLNTHLDELVDIFSALCIDLALVFAFSEIIPQKLLDLPANGFWNIHPSKLPCDRGASPLVFQIMRGERVIGMTLMKMTQQMDAGPIIYQCTYDSASQQTHDQVMNALLLEFVPQVASCVLQKKKISLHEQDHNRATYTRKITREDGYVPPEVLRAARNGRSCAPTTLSLWKFYVERNGLHVPTQMHASRIVYDYFRALHPWPGIWTKYPLRGNEKRVKILNCHLENELLRIDVVQIEGKLPVTYETFRNSYPEAS
jgi:methionyl-tRNA formyltransferase